MPWRRRPTSPCTSRRIPIRASTMRSPRPRTTPSRTPRSCRSVGAARRTVGAPPPARPWSLHCRMPPPSASPCVSPVATVARAMAKAARPPTWITPPPVCRCSAAAAAGCFPAAAGSAARWCGTRPPPAKGRVAAASARRSRGRPGRMPPACPRHRMASPAAASRTSPATPIRSPATRCWSMARARSLAAPAPSRPCGPLWSRA